MLFVSVVLSMEINRRHYIWSNLHTYEFHSASPSCWPGKKMECLSVWFTDTQREYSLYFTVGMEKTNIVQSVGRTWEIQSAAGNKITLTQTTTCSCCCISDSRGDRSYTDILPLAEGQQDFCHWPCNNSFLCSICHNTNHSARLQPKKNVGFWASGIEKP